MRVFAVKLGKSWIEIRRSEEALVPHFSKVIMPLRGRQVTLKTACYEGGKVICTLPVRKYYNLMGRFAFPELGRKTMVEFPQYIANQLLDTEWVKRNVGRGI